MSENKINSVGLSSFIYPLSCATFYGTFSSYMLSISKTVTLLSLILGYFFSLIISFLILKLFNAFPNLYLHEKLKNVYGKIYKIILFILISCSFMIYTLFTYRLTSFLSSHYLVDTNKIFILMLCLILTGYIADKSPVIITRITTILLFTSFTVYLFNIFTLIKYINFENYLPFTNVSIFNVIKSSIIFSIYFSSPLFFINLFKKNNLTDNYKFNKIFFFSNFISFVLIFISLFVTLGVFGINVSNLFDYPLYIVLKKIEVLNFLDSIENFSISIWLLLSLSASFITLSFVFNNIKILVNNNYNKYIILICSFILSYFLFFDNNLIETYSYVIYPIILFLIIIFINLITLIILKIKKEDHLK